MSAHASSLEQRHLNTSAQQRDDPSVCPCVWRVFVVQDVKQQRDIEEGPAAAGVAVAGVTDAQSKAVGLYFIFLGSLAVDRQVLLCCEIMFELGVNE